MGHGQAFTAVCAEEGYVGYPPLPPHDPIGCIRSAATFYVVPMATNVKTMIYMLLRARTGCCTGSSCLCNS
eukprot:6213149-Pleurochrysis_carterae.AAC.1